MVLSKKIICQEVTELLLTASENAAINCSSLIGLGKKNDADELAVKAMRDALSQSQYGLEVVIGEGEMDEAPMLFIGEKFGKGETIFEIAVDPLEGTNLCAKNMPNSLTTIAISEKGGFLKAPDCYMQKLATGKVNRDGILHIDFSLKENITNLAQYLKKDISELEVIMLDRERHFETMQEIRSMGAKVTLISDGDIYGIIKTTRFGDGGDLYIGTGGAPEGVLAASVMKACNGFMMGKLEFENDSQRQRAINYGIQNPSKVLALNDLVRHNSIFIASGVTNGNMLAGIKKCQHAQNYKVESIIFSNIEGKCDIKKIQHYIAKSNS